MVNQGEPGQTRAMGGEREGGGTGGGNGGTWRRGKVEGERKGGSVCATERERERERERKRDIGIVKCDRDVALCHFMNVLWKCC